MKKPIFLRTPHNYDTDAVSNETGLRCEDLSLAQQSFRDETDINNILERFNITGELPGGHAQPQYGDFLDSPVDYKQALDVVKGAQSAFNALPASLRARFDNEPSKFVDFVSDDANRKEAFELGLLEPSVTMDLPASAGGAPDGVPSGGSTVTT